MSGRQVSFTRTWGRYVDLVNLTASGSGGGWRMAGVIPNTEYSGRCELSAVKN